MEQVRNERIREQKWHPPGPTEDERQIRIIFSSMIRKKVLHKRR
jgi:hypothetical protein